MSDRDTKFELVENQEAMKLVPTMELELWWFLVGAGVLILLGVAGYLLLRKQPTAHDPKRVRREAYFEALAGLRKLEGMPGKEQVVAASLALRKYLALSMDEPALFETHEEFIGRHDALKHLSEELKIAIQGFFTELAAVKYGPVEDSMEPETGIQTRAIELLERIHAA